MSTILIRGRKVEVTCSLRTMVQLLVAHVLYQNFLHLQMKKNITAVAYTNLNLFLRERSFIQRCSTLTCPSLSQDGCCTSIRYALKAIERPSGKGCATNMCPYVLKKKYFINDLSPKTSACSSWTRATPTCMEAEVASIGFLNSIEGVRKGEGGWEWPLNIQSAVLATSALYAWVISEGGRGSCGGKHVAEVSHSHEFYERFAGKLLLRKYIWCL